MNCSHRCDAPHIFKIVTIFIACKQLVLPNSRAWWQWDKHSDYLPCGCCAPSTLAHVFTLSLERYPHSQTIDRLLCPLTWICVMYMILSSCHSFPPIFCDFSSTKRCQSCPALNIIRFLTAFLALFESPDQWRRDAATERGIPRSVAVSLRHRSTRFHWAYDPRVKKSEKAQYILQKTPVWKNWWLFCDLNIVFQMLETCGGGFCMEKHPSVEVTLFGNWLPFWEIPAQMATVRAENSQKFWKNSHMCQWV